MIYLNYLWLWVPTFGSSLLSVSGGRCRNYAKCETAKWYYTKWMAKWTCEIVGIPRNGKMEAVATDAPWLMAMAVAMDTRHPLQRDHSNGMFPTSKTANNPKGWSKFCKYRAVFRNVYLRNREWCSTADGNGGCHKLLLFLREIARTACC